jgi:hypothetical protein
MGNMEYLTPWEMYGNEDMTTSYAVDDDDDGIVIV